MRARCAQLTLVSAIEYGLLWGILLRFRLPVQRD
jgi:hypothetical protein